jgi:hypothetical protein
LAGAGVAQEKGLSSRADRKAIADQIQRYLDANGLARKDLIRDYLSKSSIEKIFQGDFTERTLNKVEGILKTTFARTTKAAAPAKPTHAVAAISIGGYVFDAVENLVGDYLSIRPIFSNPTNLNAYLTAISWSDTQNSLVFEERSRFDAKYQHNGVVYIPFGTSFMNLVSSSAGNVRTILLSLPDADDMLRGIISTLSNPKGSILVPAAAPIFLRKLRAGEKPDLGVITSEHAFYDEYQSALAVVLNEGFGVFATPQVSADRRKTIAVVNP